MYIHIYSWMDLMLAFVFKPPTAGRASIPGPTVAGSGIHRSIWDEWWMVASQLLETARLSVVLSA